MNKDVASVDQRAKALWAATSQGSRVGREVDDAWERLDDELKESYRAKIRRSDQQATP